MIDEFLYYISIFRKCVEVIGPFVLQMAGLIFALTMSSVGEKSLNLYITWIFFFKHVQKIIFSRQPWSTATKEMQMSIF